MVKFAYGCAVLYRAEGTRQPHCDVGDVSEWRESHEEAAAYGADMLEADEWRSFTVVRRYFPADTVDESEPDDGPGEQETDDAKPKRNSRIF